MNGSSREITLTKLLALAGAYFVAARFGLELHAMGGTAPLVWLPDGVALFALFVGGAWLWPVVTVAALAVSLWAGAPLHVALGMATGSTIEALAGLAILKRLGFQPSIARLNDVLALALVALAAPAISAAAGVGSLLLGGAEFPGAAGGMLRAWWVGDALGIVLLGPPLFVFSERPWTPPRAGLLEAAGLIALLAVSTALVFGKGFPADELGLARQVYLVFPPLIWAALRFRQTGTTLALLLVAATAVIGTAAGGGPFVRPHLGDSLVLLQTFLGFTSVSTLLLAAAVAERDESYEETRRALQSREEFLSIAAHELRTPLTALKLKIGLVERLATFAALPAALRQNVRGAVRLVDRLDHMIDDLLDVTRAVSGRLALDVEETDLRQVVDEVADRLRDSALRAGSPLSVSGPAACPGRWDRSRLDQVASNLVTNAIKYGSGAPIEIHVLAAGGVATLLVRDHGVGILESDHERIFERFERLSPARRQGGLGLGLWIVRQVVEAMGGTISVASEPGQGAEFRVALPTSSGSEQRG